MSLTKNELQNLNWLGKLKFLTLIIKFYLFILDFRYIYNPLVLLLWRWTILHEHNTKLSSGNVNKPSCWVWLTLYHTKDVKNYFYVWRVLQIRVYFLACKQANSLQLGLSDKGYVIKGFIVCWILLWTGKVSHPITSGWFWFFRLCLEIQGEPFPNAVKVYKIIWSRRKSK